MSDPAAITLNDGQLQLELDTERCQGHGLCLMAASTVFDLDDDGRKAVLLVEDGATLGADVVDQLGDAEMSCPESAISVMKM